MKILVRNFNAKIARGNIFKPTIENESIHEISNVSGITVVNFATSKKLSRAQCSHIAIFINMFGILLMGKNARIDHIFIDKSWRSNIVKVQSFRGGADCDN
jgi:hypothetical protein